MPDIRNRILLLLSNKKASQISTLEGKQALTAEIMSETAQALGGSVPAGGISSVLFTSFVIQ
jgi:flagellar FliL protein